MCSEPGCGRPYKAKGLCNSHYKASLKRQSQKPAPVAALTVPAVVPVPVEVERGPTYEQIAATMREAQLELGQVTGDVEAPEPSRTPAQQRAARLCAGLAAFWLQDAEAGLEGGLAEEWGRLIRHLDDLSTGRQSLPC